jgi:hypothetical protein
VNPSSLYYPLEAICWLRVHFVFILLNRQVLQEVSELIVQPVYVGVTGQEGIFRIGVIKKCYKQVLKGRVLVLPLVRVCKSAPKGIFKVLPELHSVLHGA